ncbi:MAG: class I SAM-dependent methyltransferase [Gaiellaceae bacterium]
MLTVADPLRSLLARDAMEVVDGIPRFVPTTDEAQRQTEASFAFKWARRGSYESAEMRRVASEWLVSRYGFADVRAMRDHFSNAQLVLDAGCGSGFSSSLWLDESWSATGALWVGVDISSAVDVGREQLAGLDNVHFVQADVLDLPFNDGTFGAIFSEGVLHHTPSTERALKSVVRVLRTGGELLFYVYRAKAPAREFVDDHVRAAISGLAPDEAWEQLRPLTELARRLSELRVDVDVPDVPLLGIVGGRYDVQRLIYWNFAKLFWNDALTFEENLHVNFDWYHPCYAHRQTEGEVRRWCAEAGLEIVRFHSEESGFTVRAIKH